MRGSTATIKKGYKMKEDVLLIIILISIGFIIVGIREFKKIKKNNKSKNKGMMNKNE